MRFSTGVYIGLLTFNGFSEVRAQDSISAFEAALEQERKDFSNHEYTLHSLPFYIDNNTYIHLLKEEYSIDWRFIANSDSLDYFNCYDSLLIIDLELLFGKGFLLALKRRADSLDQLDDWICEAKYFGDFRSDFLRNLGGAIDSIQVSTVTFSYTISEDGILERPVVISQLSPAWNSLFRESLLEMQNWQAPVLYGQPYSKTYYRQIRIK